MESIKDGRSHIIGHYNILWITIDKWGKFEDFAKPKIGKQKNPGSIVP